MLLQARERRHEGIPFAAAPDRKPAETGRSRHAIRRRPHLDAIQFEVLKQAALASFAAERVQTRIATGDVSAQLASEGVRLSNAAARWVGKVEKLGAKRKATAGTLQDYFASASADDEQ